MDFHVHHHCLHGPPDPDSVAGHLGVDEPPDCVTFGQPKPTYTGQWGVSLFGLHLRSGLPSALRLEHTQEQMWQWRSNDIVRDEQRSWVLNFVAGRLRAD